MLNFAASPRASIVSDDRSQQHHPEVSDLQSGGDERRGPASIATSASLPGVSSGNGAGIIPARCWLCDVLLLCGVCFKPALSGQLDLRLIDTPYTSRHTECKLTAVQSGDSCAMEAFGTFVGSKPPPGR